MSVSDLKDCAHTDERLAGVCQWQGCARQLCTRCLEDCARCGRSLCKEHQVWLDDGRTPFCEACTGGHVRTKATGLLLDHVVRRLTGGGR